MIIINSVHNLILPLAYRLPLKILFSKSGVISIFSPYILYKIPINPSVCPVLQGSPVPNINFALSLVGLIWLNIFFKLPRIKRKPSLLISSFINSSIKVSLFLIFRNFFTITFILFFIFLNKEINFNFIFLKNEVEKDLSP